MGDEFNVQQSSAPFNMAISTLESIRDTLMKIRDVSCEPLLSQEHRQLMKVQLTRQLFLLSSPLLSEEVVKKYRERFDNIKLIKKKILKTYSGNLTKTNEQKIIYSEELDIECDAFSLDIQRELQKEKYFMPPKRDMGSAVGRF